jgi:hypothetical protein
MRRLSYSYRRRILLDCTKWARQDADFESLIKYQWCLVILRWPNTVIPDEIMAA